MNKVEVITLSKKNIQNFAKERNILLSKAKSDWVFFVDSDEQVGKKLWQEINKLDFKDYDGFYILRKNYFCGDFVGQDKILRLGKKNAGKWVRRVHETWQIKGKVGELKNPLIHNTAENLSDYIRKINFYSTLHAEANREEGKTSSLLKIIIYPKMKFLVTFFKSRHFVFSLMQAFHSYLAWSKLWILQKETK